MRVMSLNPTYTAAWILWLLAFAVLEGSALCNHEPGDTLSEAVRKWLALQSRTKWAGRIVMIFFLGWLCEHFLNPK